MDIKIKSEEGNFKFRVCGIMNVGDKYLAVKIGNNSFFCLPGGHVELGEDTDMAILREMREEIGIEVKIDKMLCVIQNFFKSDDNKQFHELGYYYLVSPKNEKITPKDYVTYENDKGSIVRLEFKWFTLDQLKQIDFKPKTILSKINENSFSNIIEH